MQYEAGSKKVQEGADNCKNTLKAIFRRASVTESSEQNACTGIYIREGGGDHLNILHTDTNFLRVFLELATAPCVWRLQERPLTTSACSKQVDFSGIFTAEGE